ncbi:MAG: hypothetical protein HY898_03290 [Deltaproteobacteria bacterium]|nr:hypothetical protein [Deltaproteobacteria bacterium]
MSLAALVVVGAGVLVYDTRKPPRALQANLDRATAASMGPGAGYTQVNSAVGRFVEHDALGPLDLAAFASATDDVEAAMVACLGQDPKPAAVRVELNVEPSGLISAVTLEQPEHASDAARDCVAQAYADVRVASFDGPSEVIHKSFAVR